MAILSNQLPVTPLPLTANRGWSTDAHPGGAKLNPDILGVAMMKRLEYLNGITDQECDLLRALGVRHTNQLVHATTSQDSLVDRMKKTMSAESKALVGARQRHDIGEVTVGILGSLVVATSVPKASSW